jgi:endo-1,4-beta-xylanase
MKKLLKVFIIIALAAAAFISWRGIRISWGTDALELASFQGKTNVLKISPTSGAFNYGPILTYDLSQFVGQRITIEMSMQAWLEAPGTVVWQVNDPASWPIIAGDFTQLRAGQWHTVRGSNSVTVQPGNLLYLSDNQAGNATRYIADLTITVNGRAAEFPVANAAIPALHTKWPFYVGAVADPEDLLSFIPQHDLLRHFNVVVSGNNMKSEYIMPSPWTPTGAYRWEKADALVNYAEANNKKIRGHVLIYGEQTPRAFFEGGGRNGRATINELYARMEYHIKTVFEKYGGRIAWWDVCNEVAGWGEPTQGGYESGQSPYTLIMQDAGKTGMDRYEYVLKAFQWARRYADANGGQDVKLFLTDADIEFRGAKQTEFFRLLDYLIANNAPIDGVGMQGHIAWDSPSVRDFGNSIDAITAKQRNGKNLVVQVCELDISLYMANETNWSNRSACRMTLSERDITTRLRQQAVKYRELFDMFEQKYRQGKLDLVLIWGLADGESWKNYMPVQRTDYPLLFDRSYQPKQAYQELIRGR